MNPCSPKHRLKTAGVCPPNETLLTRNDYGLHSYEKEMRMQHKELHEPKGDPP